MYEPTTEELEQWKQDAVDAKLISDMKYLEELKKDPIATSKRSIHLLFDHYLISVKDQNTVVVNGGQHGAEALEYKTNELVGKVIGANNIQKGYLVDALDAILWEVTHDTAGLPRDELLDVLTEVRELAEAALKREGVI
jgi:hypothetical protein